MSVQCVNAAELSAPTVGDLSRVQGQTIMYEAKAKRAEAKAKMQQNDAKAGDDLYGVSGSGLTQMAAPVVASDLPTIIGISGAAGRLVATFRYPNGTSVASKSGMQIPGGYEVSEVGIDRVVITKGDRRIPLQFGVAAQQTQPAASGQMMLPGQPGFQPPAPMMNR
jgi:type IV pilus biogenesis protein PilP